AVQVKLAGLEVLSLGGALKGEKAQTMLLGLLEETDPGVRLSVLKGIEDSRLSKAAPRLVKLLGDRSRPTTERTAILKALAVLNDKSAVPAVKELLNDGPTRTEALRTLVALDPAAAQEAAKTFLEQNDLQLQREAIQVLGTQPAGAKLVAERFLA